jgi:hypothetical protein
MQHVWPEYFQHCGGLHSMLTSAAYGMNLHQHDTPAFYNLTDGSQGYESVSEQIGHSI